MNIFDSRRDLRVVVRTPDRTVLDQRVVELWASDANGYFRLEHGAPAVLASLVPGEILLRKRDGSALVLRVGWGSLCAVGDEVRIVVKRSRTRRTTLNGPDLPLAV